MYSLLLLAAASSASASWIERRQTTVTKTVTESATTSTVPDYFQTTPELFASDTPTGTAPLLVATDPVFYGTASTYAVPNPLETQIPITGEPSNETIFHYMGNVSPYFPAPGWGCDEYPLPPGANITQVQGLSRHGSRYPTMGASVETFGAKITNLTSNGTAHFTGNLSFLNTYDYGLASDVMLPQGRLELYQHGVDEWYRYGQLYEQGSKIIIRSTTQDRMVKTAENFAAGFFGLGWTQNATLELIIDKAGYNDSLAGYNVCNNSDTGVSEGGSNASTIWETTYLKDAQARFKAQGNYNWSIADVYNMQTLCPYETVAFGYSKFCDLFTFEEWKGFEYALDLGLYGTYGFAGPAARAIGIGWVEEFYARLQGHLYNLPAGSTQVNTTLDEMNSTFPLNQTLYWDFTHEVNILAVTTALGLKQFGQFLPATGPPANQVNVMSHMIPMGARLVIELVKAPHPVKATRPTSSNATTADYYETNGTTTSYIHAMLGQRTIPLGESYPECGTRDDGWCELSVFEEILSGLLETANYDYSCFGDYPAVPYGNITNGVEPTKRSLLEEQKRDGTLDKRETTFHKRANVARKLAGGMGSGLEFRSEEFNKRM